MWALTCQSLTLYQKPCLSAFRTKEKPRSPYKRPRAHTMASPELTSMSAIWLFLQIADPFCGCPCKAVLFKFCIWAPDVWKLPHLSLAFCPDLSVLQTVATCMMASCMVALRFAAEGSAWFLAFLLCASLLKAEKSVFGCRLAETTLPGFSLQGI